MFQLNYGDHRPLYEQIKEKIKELIIIGVLNENDKVPSVRELASTLAINPNTIQKAYRDLETEGYIYSVRAKGNFVAPKKETVKKSDNEELMSNFQAMISKMHFLGVSYEDVLAFINKEYKKEEKK
ncbi:MAG: GntR family transcriptional regulator [Eubacteriales bacterium]|nr:GntR family transcriptional regulator [Eubacteriales bacterium]